MLRLLGLVVAALLLATACGGGDDTELAVIDDERELQSGDVEEPEIEGGEDIATDDDAGEDDEALDTTDTAPDGDEAEAAAQGVADGDGEGGLVEERDPDAEAGPPAPEVDELDEDDANDGALAGRTGLDDPEAVVIDLATGDEVDLAGDIAASGTTVLWFWSPDSAESAAEAAAITSLAADFDGRLSVVAIGTGGDLDGAERFRQDTGLAAVTTVWDPAAETLEFYQVSAIPSIIAVSAGGDVMGRWTTLSPEVAQFLEVAG